METLMWVLAAVTAAQEILLVMILWDNQRFRERLGAGQLPEGEKDKLIHNLMAACTAQFTGFQREREIYEKERSVLWRKNEQLQAENDAQKARLDRMVKEIAALEQRLEEE